MNRWRGRDAAFAPDIVIGDGLFPGRERMDYVERALEA